ncbi:MAG: aspartate carbamoyltransferase catalytic subunit [Firmicutes bacterium]|nr:aspartate carbamoyltransferase catalytic subunit [Bacillota bacterium]
MPSLVSIEQLDRVAVERLLRRAQSFLDYQLEGKENVGKESVGVKGTAVNLFFEPSTRTALSFQLAAQRLGLKVLDFVVENSSATKGESLIDSLQTIDALGVDLAVIRHPENWPKLLDGEKFDLSLVNAGSGIHEHPTQALLDALTIRQHHGGFSDLKVAIVGDIYHSRVARSNALLLRRLGAEVSFSGPEAFRKGDVAEHRWIDFEEAVVESDVVMMLRIQHERHQHIFDTTNYNQHFGLNMSRLQQMKKNAIILHPGPVNRGVELTDDVMRDPRCKLLQQVTNGVAVRMAVLEWCLQGGSNEQLVSA